MPLLQHQFPLLLLPHQRPQRLPYNSFLLTRSGRALLARLDLGIFIHCIGFMRSLLLLLFLFFVGKLAEAQDYSEPYAYICPGDSVVLVAESVGADYYQWLRGKESFQWTIDNRIAVRDTGRYNVIAYNLDGCPSDSSNFVVVVPDSMFLNTDTALVHNTSFRTIAVLENDEVGCDPFDEQTVRITRTPNKGVATVLDGGKVLYKPFPGTSGEDHFTYVVKDTEGVTAAPGLVVIEISNLCGILYPNPTSRAVTIHSRDERVKYYQLTTMSGQRLLRGLISADPKTIDLKHFADGMYIMQLISGGGEVLCTFKVAKSLTH